MTSRNRPILACLVAALVAAGFVSGIALAEIPGSAQEVHPMMIGAKLPELTLKTDDGSSFDLNESVAGKPTILIFYRGGW